MFLEDVVLEKVILKRLDNMINWAVTQTVQVKSMVVQGSQVLVTYADINSNERYTMLVPV